MKFYYMSVLQSAPENKEKTVNLCKIVYLLWYEYRLGQGKWEIKEGDDGIGFIALGMNDKMKEIQDLINDGADVNLGVTIPNATNVTKFQFQLPVGSLIWLLRGYIFSLRVLASIWSPNKSESKNKPYMEYRLLVDMYSYLYYKILKILLENGADPNKQWSWDEMKNEGGKASVFILSAPESIGIPNVTKMAKGIIEREHNLTELLLQYGADPFKMYSDNDIQTPLVGPGINNGENHMLLDETLIEFLQNIYSCSTLDPKILKLQLQLHIEGNFNNRGLRWFYNPSWYAIHKDKVRLLKKDKDGKYFIKLLNIDIFMEQLEASDTLEDIGRKAKRQRRYVRSSFGALRF